MKLCPKCHTEHTSKGVYCSRKCANSRKFSAQAIERKKKSGTLYWNTLSSAQKQDRELIYTEVKCKQRVKRVDYLLDADWNSLSIPSRRVRVILEQNGKCNKCSFSHWLHQRITFEYEHIDGNNSNNNRNNVEALCPNCHSQTTTWRGRKNGVKQQKVIDYVEVLEDGTPGRN